MIALVTALLAFTAKPADHVMVVWIDDFGRADWEATELPRLHSLEAAGLTFTRAYANPYCSPTRFTAQFGEYGFRHGIVMPIKDTSPVAAPLEGLTSLGQLFKDQGFATLHAGKWHLSSAPALGEEAFRNAPNHYGYDAALAWSQGNLSLDGGEGHYDWTRYDNGKVRNETTYSTTAIVDAARAWWKRTPGRKFANVCFNAPHLPLNSAPRDLLPEGHLTPITERERFEGALLAIGTELDRLLKVVDLEETYVIVLSDNGTPGTVARESGRNKGSIYEGGINVPLFVLGPGIEPGKSDQLIHTVDLQATLAELFGFDFTPPRDGVSFAGALTGAAGSEREWVYCERGKPNGPKPFRKWVRTIRSADGYKLVVHADREGESTEQLFRLPDEDTPIVDEARAQELREVLATLGDG